VLIDAHTHVACGDDPRFPTFPSGVASDWWRHGGTVDELIGELDAAGVDHCVVVQAIGAYGHENSCAAASVADHPGRLALVASIDMDSGDPAASLAVLDDLLPVRAAGIRLFGVGGVEPAWLGDGRAAAVWQLAAELGTTLVPCVFTRHLPALAAVIEGRPEVPVALDHCAFPDMGDGGEAAVMRLADLPEVHLKVTSYVLEMAERDEGDPARIVDRLVSAFGANRLCWGSDHPQDQRSTYAGKVELAHHAVRDLGPAERDAVLADTARRLFFSA
jgi:L-fuconolactonase